jgi:hypothetical protein
MTGTRITIATGSGTREVALADYLDAAADEAAHAAAHAWIKSLRGLPVDGEPFRDRFTARSDSLWWFTEIYLHKTRTILDIHRVLAALEAIIAREAPRSLVMTAGSPALRHVTGELARARGVASGGTVPTRAWIGRLAALDARARVLTASALAAPARWKGRAERQRTDVAAFIHRAFWRSGGEDGAAEAYVGPVLRELERRLPPGRVSYVGIGPTANFRTPRRHRLLTTVGSTAVIPVERFAGWRALSASRAVWRARYGSFGTLTRATSIREAARIHGIDCWPIIRELLAGVAWLQWPWSVRAMDEAAAALDALSPHAVLTYAEAGGWGRALVLEARRRHIPSAGLQHGFIYRHWLNYRHEQDELAAAKTPGFPHPTRTLLFDAFTARHLRDAGRLPDTSLRVTGSPKLDELLSTAAALPAEAVARLRADLGVAASDRILLVTTKEREARGSLERFLEAAGSIEGAVVVIKPHPAETVEAYADVVEGRSRIRVVPAATSLALLLRAASAVVTVNSTVALDAGALEVPAVSIGLPNNLSPLVDAGAIAGSADAGALPAILRRILYDGTFREQLAARRRAVLGEQATLSAGAAGRSADAVLELINEHRRDTGQAG